MKSKTQSRFPGAACRLRRSLERNDDREWFIPRKHISGRVRQQRGSRSRRTAVRGF